MNEINHIPYLIVFKDSSFCKYKTYLEVEAADNQEDFIIVYTLYDDIDYLFDGTQFVAIPEVDQSMENLYEYLTSIINKGESNV